MNSPSIHVEFKSEEYLLFKFTFLNVTMLIFDSEINQNICLAWKSVTFHISKHGFENLKLIWADGHSDKESIWLLIPFPSIISLEVNELKTTLTPTELNEQFQKFHNSWINWNWAFLIPLKYLQKTEKRIDFEVDEFPILNFEVEKEVMNAKYTYCQIKNFNDLIKLKQLGLANFSNINFSWYDMSPEANYKNTEINIIHEISMTKFKLSKLSINHELSREEYKLICELLCNRRIRFWISYIWLKFKSIGDWLHVLSLWANCTEFNFIHFIYTSWRIRQIK